jgi:hypothetical protein
MCEIHVNRQERAAKISEQKVHPAPFSLPNGIIIAQADAARLPVEAGTIDVIVTSPPCGLEIEYGTPDSPNSWEAQIRVLLVEMPRVTRTGGRLALNIALDTAKGGERPRTRRR